MGFRETLRDNPVAIKIACVTLIVVCVMVIIMEVRGPRHMNASAVGNAFYSDDDGKSWFVDNFTKGSPFDHDGKQAYRAIVYRCGAGKPFVGFLAQFSAEQIAAMNADIAGAPPGTLPRGLSTPKSLRKPGQSTWVTNTTPSMTPYPDIPSPDGTGHAVLVAPGDPDQ